MTATNDLAAWNARALDAMCAIWEAAADAETRWDEGREEQISFHNETHDPELPMSQQRRLRPRRT